MTKKGIIASVFAVICAVCLIVMACIFGIQSSNASTTPTTVNDDKATVQGEKASQDGEKTENNTQDETKNDDQVNQNEIVVTEIVTDPVVTDPDVTDPVITNPEITDPDVTDPVVTDPDETETGDDPAEVTVHDTLGDVNLDDKVDLEDWKALKSMLDGEISPTSQQFINADVNKDGALTTTDLKLIKLNADGVISLPSTIKTSDCDLNNDGKTNVKDVEYWNDNIDNLAAIPAENREKFDVDKNGKINNTDYAIVSGMVDKLESNGNCSVFFVDNFYGSKANTRVAVMTGHHVSELVPTSHARHAFSGWYLDAKCTMKVDFTAPITSDMIMYAKWTPIYYVEFVDGGEVIDTTGVLVGKTVSPLTLTREGYDFDGWYVDKEFKNKFDFNTALTQDYTVYAKWTKLFTVTYVNVFYTHDGKTMHSSASEEVVKVRNGEFAENKNLGVVRLLDNMNNGYAEFVGWSTTPIEITNWTPNAKNADKIATGDVKVKFFDFSKPITSDQKVYAKWIYHYVDVGQMTLADLVSAIDKDQVAHETDASQMTTGEFYTYDLNFDGKIDEKDIAVWANTQGAKAAKITPSINGSADVNRDGAVDGKDVLGVARDIVANKLTGVSDVNGDLKINIDDLATVLKTAGYEINNESATTEVVGDLNLDGVVDGLDSVVLNKYLSKDIGLTDAGLKNADVNADTAVNSVDQQVMAMYLRKYIDKLPHAFKGDAVDVNGDGKIDAEDTAAWNAIFADYKKTIADMEKALDVNIDGVVDANDLARIAEYLNYNTVSLLDCSVEYEGKVTTLRSLMNSVFSKDGAHSFKITIKINDEKFIENVSIDTLNVIMLDLTNYKNGDKIDITYTYDQAWVGDFWGKIGWTHIWDNNKQINHACKLVK